MSLQKTMLFVFGCLIVPLYAADGDQKKSVAQQIKSIERDGLLYGECLKKISPRMREMYENILSASFQVRVTNPESLEILAHILDTYYKKFSKDSFIVPHEIVMQQRGLALLKIQLDILALVKNGIPRHIGKSACALRADQKTKIFNLYVIDFLEQLYHFGMTPEQVISYAVQAGFSKETAHHETLLKSLNNRKQRKEKEKKQDLLQDELCALMRSTALNKEQIVGCLKRGADMNKPCSNGLYPLMYALLDDQMPVEAIRILVQEFKADVNSKAEDGIIPLLCTSDKKIIAFLKHAGAKIDHADPKGDTPLITAARAGNAQLVDVLVEHNVTLQARALFRAILEGHCAIVQSLVDAGISLDTRLKGKTVLQCAEDTVAQVCKAKNCSDDCNHRNILEFLTHAVTTKKLSDDTKHCLSLQEKHERKESHPPTPKSKKSKRMIRLQREREQLKLEEQRKAAERVVERTRAGACEKEPQRRAVQEEARRQEEDKKRLEDLKKDLQAYEERERKRQEEQQLEQRADNHYQQVVWRQLVDQLRHNADQRNFKKYIRNIHAKKQRFKTWKAFARERKQERLQQKQVQQQAWTDILEEYANPRDPSYYSPPPKTSAEKTKDQLHQQLWQCEKSLDTLQRSKKDKQKELSAQEDAYKKTKLEDTGERIQQLKKELEQIDEQIEQAEVNLGNIMEKLEENGFYA